MRDYNDRKYKQARIDCLKRDKFQCRKCKARKRLQVHHIRPYADNPELLCQLSNLITLCKKCHDLMTGSENAYIPMCISLLNPDRHLRVLRAINDLENEEKNEE